MSVIKALEHSAFRCQRKLTLHVRLPISCLKSYELVGLLSQWVESSDLEPENQDADPKKYHDAWRTIVGAG
jgi:CTP synthase